MDIIRHLKPSDSNVYIVSVEVKETEEGETSLTMVFKHLNDKK